MQRKHAVLMTCVIGLVAGLLWVLVLSPSRDANRRPNEVTGQTVPNANPQPATANAATEPQQATRTDGLADLSVVREDLMKHMEREVLKSDQILQLEAVLAHDKKIAAKYDMPSADIKTAKTSALCTHFSRSPMRVWFGLYDDRNMGIARAIRASNTLSELVLRDDIIDGLAEHYNAALVSASENKKDEAGEISMSLLISDELLMYPPVFEKTKGREKEILLLLSERYRKLSDINRIAGKDAPYSAVLDTTKKLAFDLIQKLDPNGKWPLPTEKEEPAWFQRIESRCR